MIENMLWVCSAKKEKKVDLRPVNLSWAAVGTEAEVKRFCLPSSVASLKAARSLARCGELMRLTPPSQRRSIPALAHE